MAETRDIMGQPQFEEKDTRVVANDSLSDVEASAVDRRNGSIWTIVGCAFANLSDGYQQNLVFPSRSCREESAMLTIS